MSLATSAGIGMPSGGGAGGLMMAHQANAMAHAPPPPHAEPTATSYGAPPIAVGADLYDKNQPLSFKQVENVSHLPIVAVDLHSSGKASVAFFPPNDEEDSSQRPVAVGALESTVIFKKDENAHKTLRKFLTKSRAFSSLQADSLAGPKDKSVVKLEKPQRWLGLRRLDDAPDFVLAAVHSESDPTPAIAEEALHDVTMVVSTLDGSVPQGDDFDRVVAKVRLHSSKKALTLLPEEAVQILLHKAQYLVSDRVEDEEDIESCPLAVALPAWAYHDAAVEALLEASGSGGVFFPRSVCALAGAVLPEVDGKPTSLLERLIKVCGALQKEFQKKQVNEPDAIFDDSLLVILFGMNDEGLEATAIQVGKLNPQNMTCLFSEFKVLSNVSYQSSNPLSKMGACSKELEAAVDTVAPEADGPAAILFYGSTKEQTDMKSTWETLKVEQKEWQKVPSFTCKDESVAMGCAVLGGNSHGRIVQAEDRKTKKLALQVDYVAPVALGIMMNYHSGDKSKWTPVKTIFDFDRRVPAGPYDIDLNAADCAVYREFGHEVVEEELIKLAKQFEGSKGIPKREEAALSLRVQIVQKWTRDGEWKKCGDLMEPLVKTDLDKDGKETREACERVSLQLSLSVTGMITNSLVGERESVVQALMSARKSSLQYYIGILVAILFFGGFLVKSYWEEYVFERDVKRLLAYYKHVIPGSMADGDRDNARYVVWKYRYKKDRLWKMLEKKYGVQALEADEWPEEQDSKAEDDTVNLDDNADSTNESNEQDL